MAALILVKIDSGNNLLPDSTKPYRETTLTHHQRHIVTITWGQFEKRQPWITKLTLNTSHLKFISNIQGSKSKTRSDGCLNCSWHTDCSIHDLRVFPPCLTQMSYCGPSSVFCNFHSFYAVFFCRIDTLSCCDLHCLGYDIDYGLLV